MSPDPAKPAPTIPVVQREDPKSIAARTLEAAFARDETTQEEKAIVAAESIWAYSCGRELPGKPKHMGIFFVKDPRGQLVFGPGDWYAVYHDPSQAFDFEHADIVCQQCFAETGERVPLRVSQAPPPSRGAGAHFRIQEGWMQRFAFEIKRKDMEEWLKKKTTKEPADARRKQPA